MQYIIYLTKNNKSSTEAQGRAWKLSCCHLKDNNTEKVVSLFYLCIERMESNSA